MSAKLKPCAPPAALEWICGHDTGTSSKTIWAVLSGVVQLGPLHLGWPLSHYDIPYDMADLGRCVRLLDAVPEWQGRIGEVAEIFPAYAPIIERWDELTRLYREGNGEKIYRIISGLRDEVLYIDGYDKTGPCSHHRDKNAGFRNRRTAGTKGRKAK